MYKLIYARYQTEYSEEFDELWQAKAFARNLLEFNNGYPLDLFEDGNLVATNRDGSPLIEGETPLLAMIDADS